MFHASQSFPTAKEAVTVCKCQSGHQKEAKSSQTAPNYNNVESPKLLANILFPIVNPRCSILTPHPPRRHHYCHHHYHHPSVLSLPEVSGIASLMLCRIQSLTSLCVACLTWQACPSCDLWAPFVLALPGNLHLLLVSTPLARGESARSLSRCGKFRVSKSRHENLSLLAVTILLYEELQLAISTVFEASLSAAADFGPSPFSKSYSRRLNGRASCICPLRRP